MENNSKWVAATIGRDSYKTEITTDTHTLIADEPAVKGGKDLGPAPGDFLRMSLAACTAITLRMYANRKGYALENIEVKVFTESQNGKTVFNRSIRFEGNLEATQRQRLLQIANACPIHKVLTNPIEVVTKLI